MPDPLADIRVLDLTDESGLLTGRILADLGADVVLVEPPNGSRARGIAPFVDDQPGPERSYRHLYFNANKRSIVLDLTTLDDRARLLDLVGSSDLLLETAAPGTLGAIGLDHDVLRARNPSLIQVSLTPFGLAGEWAGWKGNDLTGAAASGLLQISGERDDPPAHGPAFPAYTMAALTAASAAMIGLWGRDTQFGRPGSHFDISIQEAASFATIQTSNPNHYTSRGEIPVRPALSQTMRCADGKWVGVNVLANHLAEFIELLDEAGIEHDFTADDWQVQHSGGAVWKYLDNPLQYKAMELATRYSRDEFLEKMWLQGSAAMPTMDFQQMLESEHYRVSGQFRDLPNDVLSRSFSFSRSPVGGVIPQRPIKRAPLLGEHSSAVLPPPGDQHLPQPFAQPMAEIPQMPLAGIRVLDFTWVLAGPLGTRILSNFGAEVIKVESSVRMDSLRGQALPGNRYHADLGDLFNDANTGKRSLTLDLTSARGRELIRDLIAKSDVVVNNYTSGKLAAMGFPYEELRELNPKLVLIHLPGVGGDSPWVSHRTLGNLLMAASGQNFLMGLPERPPRGMGIAYPDFTTPHLFVASALAALREAQRSGRGREIELSQLSATVSLLGAEWMRFVHTGKQPARPGNRDPNYCPHGVYPTRADSNDEDDQWIAIAVGSDHEWRALAALMGDAAPQDASRYATDAGRRANEDTLEAHLATWTATHNHWTLAELLQDVGIAAAPVENLRDMIETDPQMRHHYQRIRQPSDPDFEITIDGEPIRLTGRDRMLERAPTLGAHNEYVLREILGLTQQDFDALVVNGVVA